MLNKINKVFYAAVCAALLSACTIEHDFKPDSSKEYDPLSFKIFIQNESGNDLLDTTSQNYSGQQVTIKFKGSQYKINIPFDAAVAHNYQQITLKKSADNGKFYIAFDNIDGAKNYDDDIMVIWKLKNAEQKQAANQIDIIHLKHIFYQDTPRTQWLFNGKETEYDSNSAEFIITK